MKKVFCLFFAFFPMLTSFAAKAPLSIDQKKSANTEAAVSNIIGDETLKPSSIESLSQLSIKDLQNTIHRKLTLQEKISWLLFKKKLPHLEPSESEKAHANTNAILGFVFSLLGLFVFQLFAIPGLILSNKALNAERADPGILRGGNKGLATAGKIISIVDLVLLLIVLIIIIAFVSNFH